MEEKKFKEYWEKYLKGKEVRGIYSGKGSFNPGPDCYKFKDIREMCLAIITNSGRSKK